MRRPLNEPCQITSHYGERVLNGVKQFHPGLDLVAANRSVFAVADGIVCFDYDNYNEKNRWNGASLDSTGNLVIIKSEIGGKTYFIRYMHLVKNLVSDKQPIKEGQLLGEYGDVTAPL